MRALRVLGALVALSLLAGCGLFSSPPEPPKLLTRAEADARTVVPFTRGVRLDKAGRIVDVTFDLPAPEKPAVPILKIGLRLQYAEARALLDASDKITEGGLAARLRLDRLDGKAPGPVQLWAVAASGRDLERLSSDGVVRQLSTGSVDTSSLIQAGLHSEEALYRILQLAQVGWIEPGSYKLSVELIADDAQLAGTNAELIVGYQSLGK